MTPADLRAAVAWGLAPSDQGTDTRLTRSNDVNDATKDVLARLEAKTRNTGNVSFMQAYEGGPWVHKSILAADPLCAEAAALIRAKDAENARLVDRVAELEGGRRPRDLRIARQRRELASYKTETARLQAALATERTARLAAEKRVGELTAALGTAAHQLSLQSQVWSDDARAALTKEKPNG